MIPKENRINKDKEFEHVFKKGRSKYNEIFGIKAASNKLGVTRFGIIVSGKVSKKSVERNLIKRRIREAAKEELNSIRPGFDIVIIALPEIKGKPLSLIRHNMHEGLSKLSVFKKV
jgi:ribonuclease P protein component